MKAKKMYLSVFLGVLLLPSCKTARDMVSENDICGEWNVVEIQGEPVRTQFLKDTVGTTGCEISFGTIEPGQAAPFFHSHKQNEEIYIILSGSGDFQVNDTAFPIAEGSIVRVATASNRSIRCTSTEKMLYICIQAKEGSLEQCTMEDGEITQQETKW